MRRTPTKILVLLIIGMIMLGAAGCRGAESSTHTLTATLTRTPTATQTFTTTPTPTATLTRTPANTITPQPSNTPTQTQTPFPTLSPTPSPTQAPLRPAVLFPYQDLNGRTVDWSYAHITRIRFNRLDEVNDLWAFLAFQLLDRAIHQRNFNFLGEPITVYYLNVAHEFNGEMMPMQLVLGGTPGENIAIQDIPAGGTAYVQVQVRESDDHFVPYIVHRDANRDYELRESAYPLLFLKELQTLLPTLPDEVILLADHPILFPPDDWPQLKLDMRRVSYLAARYQPFFEIDQYDRLADQSDFAYALRDHLLFNETVSEGIYAYSSNTLIIIKGD